MGRLVLTGIGPMTPIGIGKKQFWDAVVEGSSGIRKITRFSSPTECYGGQISDIDFNEYINNKSFRRAADISKYAFIAINLAISDAGIKKFRGEDTALVVGITHGALNYTQIFHRALLKEGADAISPILFSDSVLNAPASNSAICFGNKGPVHTLVGGPTIAVKAIMLAFQMMTAKKISSSIVMCAEELNELSFFCYSRLGIDNLSEGAGAIIIENEDDIKESHPYCYISGIASQFNPSKPEAAFAESLDRCLKMSGLVIGDIDLVMTNSSHTSLIPSNLFNSIPAGCILPLAGNAFSVTTTWHVIISALILRNGLIPASVIINKARNYKIPNNIRNILVCSTEEEGSASVVILSKCL